MKLIDDWKQSYRYLSVQLAAAIVFVAELQIYLPEVREHLPEDWYKWAALAVIAARVISQKKPEAT